MKEVNENNNLPLISVIIPVYNVEKYLNECVDSVINQTYKNLEIILVDDGSTDSSGNICDEYASIDSRVVVIHKENGGQGSAKNVALDVCKGEYITFLDSDDFFEKDAIEFLYSKELETDADTVACLFYIYFKNMCVPMTDYFKEKLLTPNEAYFEMLNSEYVMPTQCGKLFKKCVFNKVRYHEGIIYEDTHIVPDLIKNTKSVFATTEPKIYYRQCKGSTMNKGFNKKIMDMLFIYKHCLDEAKANFPNAIHICKKRYYESFVFVLRKIIDGNAEFGEEYKEVLSLIKKHFFSLIFFPGFSLERRMSFILLMINPKKYISMYRESKKNSKNTKEYFD